jgi:hypothetical protein
MIQRKIGRFKTPLHQYPIKYYNLIYIEAGETGGGDIVDTRGGDFGGFDGGGFGDF